MDACTGKKKDGSPCGMRPKKGEALCMNCKRKAEAPAAAAETERALMPGESDDQVKPAKKASSKTAASSSGSKAGELVAGVLVGLLVVVGSAWAIITSGAKAST